MAVQVGSDLPFATAFDRGPRTPERALHPSPFGSSSSSSERSPCSGFCSSSSGHRNRSIQSQYAVGVVAAAAGASWPIRPYDFDFDFDLAAAGAFSPRRVRPAAGVVCRLSRDDLLRRDVHSAIGAVRLSCSELSRIGVRSAVGVRSTVGVCSTVGVVRLSHTRRVCPAACVIRFSRVDVSRNGLCRRSGVPCNDVPGNGVSVHDVSLGHVRHSDVSADPLRSSSHGFVLAGGASVVSHLASAFRPYSDESALGRTVLERFDMASAG